MSYTIEKVVQYPFFYRHVTKCMGEVMCKGRCQKDFNHPAGEYN